MKYFKSLVQKKIVGHSTSVIYWSTAALLPSHVFETATYSGRSFIQITGIELAEGMERFEKP
jgi:hypothetical protein